MIYAKVSTANQKIGIDLGIKNFAICSNKKSIKILINLIKLENLKKVKTRAM